MALALFFGGWSNTFILHFDTSSSRMGWAFGGIMLTGIIVIWILISHDSSVVVSAVRRRVILMSIGLAGGFLVLLFLTPYWATGLGDDPPGPNEPLQSNKVFSSLNLFSKVSLMAADRFGMIAFKWGVRQVAFGV